MRRVYATHRQHESSDDGDVQESLLQELREAPSAQERWRRNSSAQQRLQRRRGPQMRACILHIPTGGLE